MTTNRKYSNNEITVFWRPKECVHASICFTKLYSVFNPRRRPWIVLDGADTEAVINIVNECPTRALTFMWNDVEKNAAETNPKAEKDIDSVTEEFAYAYVKEKDNQDIEIKIMRNGPIIISGEFKMFDENESPMRPLKMASLCRCGHSLTAPFCDGNHFRRGFRDDG